MIEVRQVQQAALMLSAIAEKVGELPPTKEGTETVLFLTVANAYLAELAIALAASKPLGEALRTMIEGKTPLDIRSRSRDLH